MSRNEWPTGKPIARINGSPILTGNKVQVLCSCVVDLISRLQRPYVFKVTVCGQPPHNVVRTYTIAARSDNDAASEGLRRFEKEMQSPLSFLGAMM